MVLSANKNLWIEVVLPMQSTSWFLFLILNYFRISWHEFFGLKWTHILEDIHKYITAWCTVVKGRPYFSGGQRLDLSVSVISGSLQSSTGTRNNEQETLFFVCFLRLLGSRAETPRWVSLLLKTGQKHIFDGYVDASMMDKLPCKSEEDIKINVI